MIFLFDVSMRWIGLRLDLMAGMMTVGTTLVLVLTKGYIPPASGGLVLGLCGKVRNSLVRNTASCISLIQIDRGINKVSRRCCEHIV